MTDTQITKLERLSNHPTRYELVLSNEATGQRFRLAYILRKNRSGLIDAIRRNGAELEAFTGSTTFDLSKKGHPAAAQLGSWRASFSGRTQREAIQAGELRWFAAKEEA